MPLIQIPKMCGVKYLCMSIKIWSGWQKGGTRPGVAEQSEVKVHQLFSYGLRRSIVVRRTNRVPTTSLQPAAVEGVSCTDGYPHLALEHHNLHYTKS